MIHKFMFDGHYFVLDAASGSVHVVDEPVFFVLDYFTDNKGMQYLSRLIEKYGIDTVAECRSEIMSLKESGLLFTRDTYADIPLAETGKPVVKALCLHMAHDCNLACAYCFGGTGSFSGERGLMPLETAKKAIDFLLNNSGNRENLEADFFGGEPLMNFEALRQTVAYAREKEAPLGKKIHFTLTTNGYALTDGIISYINEHMENVVLSLDGRREVNDALRKTRDGGGSYDAVMPKLLKLAREREACAQNAGGHSSPLQTGSSKDYFVRGTYTAKNLDFAADVLHLADLGFRHISVEPVVLNKKSPLAIKEADLDTIYAEYETLARIMTKRGDFEFFHYNIDLTGGPCVYKRLKGCGAGTEYFAVTPAGEIYPCHQFVGNKKYLMGSIETGIENKAVSEQFAEAGVYTNEQCGECWARFFCGGGCMANAETVNGNITKPYDIGCQILKKRTECGIAYGYLSSMEHAAADKLT